MKYLSLFLCLKYLSRKKIVLLSIAAVAMSCGLLIVVASLFTGFITAVENSASDQVGDVVIAGLQIPQYDKFINQLEANQTIEAATAVLSGQGLLLIGKGNVRAVQIWAIELPKRTAVTPFADSLISRGKTDRPVNFAFNGSTEQMPTGFLGIGIIAEPDEKTDQYDWDRVKAAIGTEVLLTTATAKRDSRPKTIKFTVADVVFSGIYQFDKDFIYLPIENFSEILYPGRGKIADMIHIKLKPTIDPAVGAAVVRGLWRQFAGDQLQWSDYLISLAKIETATDMQAKYVAELQKQMGMLMLIFGVVSGGIVLLIFCIFYLIVITKQKDIAIVKSCGTGSGAVAGLFVAFGLITGLLGSGIGIAVGYFVTKNVNTIERWISVVFGLKLWKSSTYMFSKVPNQVNWESVFWIAIAAILAAGIGALIPALTAARVKPVEILRYE